MSDEQVSANSEVLPADELKQSQQDGKGLRERLWASRQANYENLDKAILSLSSGVLVLSMGFFKDVVPIEKAIRMDVLFASWIFLGIVIGCNLLSFWVSQKAHDLRLDEIDGDKEAPILAKRYSLWTECLNRVGIVLFLAAIFCSITFVIINVSEAQRRKPMVETSESLVSKPNETPKSEEKPARQEPDHEKRGIVPPKPPTRPPSQTPSTPAPSKQTDSK